MIFDIWVIIVRMSNYSIRKNVPLFKSHISWYDLKVASHWYLVILVSHCDSEAHRILVISDWSSSLKCCSFLNSDWSPCLCVSMSFSKTPQIFATPKLYYYTTIQTISDGFYSAVVCMQIVCNMHKKDRFCKSTFP